jgi:hypothetical protein
MLKQRLRSLACLAHLMKRTVDVEGLFERRDVGKRQA